MTDTYVRGSAGFTLSTADWAALRAELEVVEAAIAADNSVIFQQGLIVDLYNSLLSKIPTPDSVGAPSGEFDAVWTWINGAAGVNGRSNFNGVFIHEITKKQYVLRFGEDGTNLDDLAQKASNDLGLNVIRDVLYGTQQRADVDTEYDATGQLIGDAGSLPGIKGLGIIDAGTVAANVFEYGPYEEGDFAPWAGTLLFPYLGVQDFYGDWVLSSTPVSGTAEGVSYNFKTTTGTYDLVSIVEASRDAAQFASLNHLGTAAWNLFFGPQGVITEDQSNLVTETNQFFQNYYGLTDEGRFRVGEDTLFFGNGFDGFVGRIAAQIGNSYQVGMLGDDVGINALITGLGAFNITNAGTGDDTILVQYGTPPAAGIRPSNLIDGAEGVDTVDYSSFEEGTEIELQFGVFGEHDYRVVVDGGATNNQGDYLYAIEKLIATDHVDTLKLSGAEFTQPFPVHIDFGNNPNGLLDIIDASALDEGVRFMMGGSTKSASTSSGGSVTFTGAGKFIGTAHDDVFKHAKAGALITTGDGADKIGFSKGLGVTDASGEDRVIMYGKDLGGLYLRNAKSESAFAFGNGGATKIAFNSVGEMGIGDQSSEQGVDESFMYLMGANQNPFAATGDRTAGIRVAEIEIDAYQLMEKPAGVSARSTEMWKFAALTVKDLVADAKVARSDPLVLDLDGDGIELINVLSPGVGANFDIDGDGFAEPTGWVGGDDGMLVVDTNGNGLIDDVDELFGKGSTTGYSELETYDTNNDGVVDALDDNFTDLLVWQDADGDAVTDAGELKTLGELGIASISLTHTDTTTEIGDNIVARTGTFTFADGSTGTIGDVDFKVNNFNTTFLGDVAVDPTLTANMPKLKGYGTLADLDVAITLQGTGGALAATINSQLSSLDTLDLTALRLAAMPILQAWAQATPIPTDAGTPTPGGNVDVALLIDARNGGRPVVSNFAILVTEDISDGNGGMVSSTHYKLFGGGAIVDGNGDVILAPTLTDIMAQATGDPGLSWETLTGTEIDFMERFMGEEMPINDISAFNSLSVAALSSLLGQLHLQMEFLALRLAMQGPLEPYFASIEYDQDEDNFRPTTDKQLVPMLEAIFAAAPSSTADAWLESWAPILQAMLFDYDRGGAHLLMTRPFVFTNIVAAYENVPAVGIGMEQAAIALGIPSEMLNFGTGTREGTNDSDMFYMGAGDDIARGAKGGDVYVFGRDFGNDRIEDYQESGKSFDTIRFAYLNAADIEATRIGLDLQLKETGTSNTVLIKNQFHELVPGLFGGYLNADESVEEIVFADGTVWTPIDIAKAVSKPDATDQTIIGTDHVDFLDGGAGNDLLVGGDGLDFYLFDVGYGQDQIEERIDNHLNEQTDVVVFGAGITRDNVRFSYNGVDEDLLITVDGHSDTLSIKGQFNAFYSGPFGVMWLDRIETFQFADGSSVEWTEIIRTVVANAKTSGDDIITGFGFEDILDGGAGNDRLIGGSENDTYVFGLGYGQDTVFEGTRNNILSGQDDRVLFTDTLTRADVVFSRDPQDDAHLLISVVGTNDTLTIEETFSSSTIAPTVLDIETYEFSDGTILTLQDVQENILSDNITVGADITKGFRGADFIQASAGDDLLNGWDGDDTYNFGVGSDNDTIHEKGIIAAISGDDTLKFGSGITASDLTIARDGRDAVISHVNGQDSIRIVDQHWMLVGRSFNFAIERFVFEDGAIWTDADIRAQTLVSTAQNDTLVGFSSADILDGGAGDDRLEGGDGGDTYVMGLGYGSDTILEGPGVANSAETSDRVVFGPGILPADLTVIKSADDLIITIGNGGDSLTIEQFFASAANEVEEFHFENGVIWFRAEIDAALAGVPVPLPTSTLSGTTASETLNGTNSDDVIFGDQGDDVISGGAGNDVYVYRLGDGADTIKDVYYQGALDLLVLGAGITPGSVGLVRGLVDREDVTLTFADGGSILLDEQFYQVGTPGVENIKFENGIVWQAGALRAMVLAASQTDLDDTVLGYVGLDDTLDGGLGNDTLEGLTGSDTYIYESGDGNDTIIEKFNHTGIDTLAFGTGITQADLTFVRGMSDVDDLTIQIAGGGSVFLDEQFFQSGTPGIEAISFHDGSSLNLAGMRLATLNASITSGNETTYGFANSADTFLGSAGNDILRGLSGNDTYYYNLGDGDDQIYEGDADGTADRVVFGAGITTTNITLDPGHTHLYDLTFNFSDGNSLLLDLQRSTSGAAGVEFVEFADGTVWTDADIARFLGQIGTSADETMTGTADVDRLVGGGGNDTFVAGAGDDLMIGGSGADSFDGGVGTDTVSYANASSGVLAHMGDWNQNTGEAAGDSYASVEILEGSAFDDTLIGDAVKFSGGAGNDTITSYSSTGSEIDGGAGNDAIHTSSGDDTVIGGAGDDTVITYGGADTLILGDGDDYAVSGTENDTVNGGAGSDEIHGGAGNDTINGGAGNDSLHGDEGDDAIDGNDGDDYIAAGDGHDTINGGAGEDEVRAGAGNDTINGGAGNDSLHGDEGDDVIDFGLGDDYATGGTGADTFIFKAGYGADEIGDLEGGAGAGDVIELQSSLAADYTALQGFMNDWGGPHTFIEFGNGDSITLWDTVMADLHADDFRFVA